MSDWDSVRQRVDHDQSHRRLSASRPTEPSAVWDVSSDEPTHRPLPVLTRWPRLYAAWRRAARYLGSLLRP